MCKAWCLAEATIGDCRSELSFPEAKAELLGGLGVCDCSGAGHSAAGARD